MYTQIMYLSNPKRYRIVPILRETMSEKDKINIRLFVGMTEWPTLEKAKKKSMEIEEGLNIFFLDQHIMEQYKILCGDGGALSSADFNTLCNNIRSYVRSRHEP